MKLSAAKPCRYGLFAIAEIISGRVREGGQDRRWSLGFIGGSFIWLDYLVGLLAQTFGSGFDGLVIEASIVGVHGLMEFFGHAVACRS